MRGQWDRGRSVYIDRLTLVWAPVTVGKASDTKLQKLFCLFLYICVGFRAYETLGTQWLRTKIDMSHQSRSQKELVSSVLDEPQ